ncbi:MAG: hypothetical protein V4772_24355 [Pseudomonadota bacterium]
MPATYNRMQVALLALLPKDGAKVSVAQLARDAGIAQPAVTNELFDVWFAGAVQFDVRADSYFVLPKTTNSNLST